MQEQGFRESIAADQIFSWISLAWIELYGEENFTEVLIKPSLDGRPPFLISNFFPQINGKNSYPTPLIKISLSKNDTVEIEKKKRSPWIHEEAFNRLRRGESLKEEDFRNPIKIKNIVSANLNLFTENETQPFYTSVLSSTEESSLSFRGQLKLINKDIYKNLNSCIQFAKDEGFGANRSSGYGIICGSEISKEDTVSDDPSAELFNSWISLSDFIPNDDDLQSISADTGARYKLTSRAGWIYKRINQASPIRKQKSFLFEAGSSFTKKPFGSLISVGYHEYPSYRYAFAFPVGIKTND